MNQSLENHPSAASTPWGLTEPTNSIARRKDNEILVQLPRRKGDPETC